MTTCPCKTTLKLFLFIIPLHLHPPLAWSAPEAREIGPTHTNLLPRGKEADGIIGDFVLRNNRVEAVISGNLPLRRANMSTFSGTNGMTPGCLYDLTLRGENNDQLTIFAPAGQQGPVSWVRIAEGQTGEAAIETVVTAAANNGLFKSHRYELKDDWQGILISTTWRNESSQELSVTSADRWTTFLKTGTWNGITWADAVDPSDKTGYAFGAATAAESGANGKPFSLRPGESRTHSRFLAVGRSPAEACGLVAARRAPTGRVMGRIVDREGKPVPTAQLLCATTAGRTNCIAYPDKNGEFAFQLPPGEHRLEARDIGRAPVARTISIRADADTADEWVMARASALEFDIKDEQGRSLPCKIQFHGVEGTASPYLGPHNRAHGCVDQFHSEKGQFRVALDPGKYRIVVTRGMEYSHVSRVVALPPETIERFAGVLRRMVDTTGWVSADYHNHSTPSGDNTCGTDDRIINLAAEGIEFAPTTEHNRFYDWQPHIQKLGLLDYLQTVPGIELTGSGPHLNSFPFRPVPFRQDAGAPVWNRDPRISALLLRDWQWAEPDRWIQINHPDMVENFIDRDADGRVDGGFYGLAELIDGVETQNYSGSEILGGRPFRIGQDAAGKEMVFYLREFIWLQMLNRGHRYAGMAVNDAHSVYGNGVGSWRMYLPSKSDHPGAIDWRENSRHAKAGRSILTTGPFLQVQTDQGILPGGTAPGPGGVKLKIKVQCADWLDIDRVQVLVNGRQPPNLNFTRKTHSDWFGAGVVKFEKEIDVALSEDAHLIVVAYGENFDLAKGFGTSTQARIKPCAYHNPIFVDVDGGGFKPNGDTLDWPLPAKKLTVEQVRKLTAGWTSH